MGLSYEEALALGIGHEHPDHPGRRGEPAAASAPKAGRPKRAPSPDGMNKSERAYSLRLTEAAAGGTLLGWYFEPIKLRLAGRCWLKVDFVAFLPSGAALLIDVKGHLEDDASVKLKVSAERYPLLPLFLVFRAKGGWAYRPVTRTGIGAWCEEPFG